MKEMVIINIEQTDSTNSLLRKYEGEKGILTIASADYQSHGRGQGTNSWESQPYQNLLYSILVYPESLPANRQFVMLEAQSLAIKEVLDNIFGYPDNNLITIKWPNDIYYKDYKLSGTLTECVLKGTRCHSCIIGTGINVNQTIFQSDAPNPISLKMITGNDYDRKTLLDRLVRAFSHYMDMVNNGDYDSIHQQYLQHLYRLHGIHRYQDATGMIMAEFVDVTPIGHLILRTIDGDLREYEFKEVKFIL